MTNVVFWLLVCDYCVLVSAVCFVGLFIVFLYMLYFIVSLGAQNTLIVVIISCWLKSYNRRVEHFFFLRCIIYIQIL